jgi:hypothetical protein
MKHIRYSVYSHPSHLCEAHGSQLLINTYDKRNALRIFNLNKKLWPSRFYRMLMKATIKESKWPPKK